MRFEYMVTMVREYLEWRCGDKEFARQALSCASRTLRTSGDIYDEMQLLARLPGDMRAQLLRVIAIEAEKKVFACVHRGALPHAIRDAGSASPA